MIKAIEIIASGILVFLTTLFIQRNNINWFEISLITAAFIIIRIIFIVAEEIHSKKITINKTA